VTEERTPSVIAGLLGRPRSQAARLSQALRGRSPVAMRCRGTPFHAESRFKSHELAAISRVPAHREKNRRVRLRVVTKEGRVSGVKTGITTASLPDRRIQVGSSPAPRTAEIGTGLLSGRVGSSGFCDGRQSGERRSRRSRIAAPGREPPLRGPGGVAQRERPKRNRFRRALQNARMHRRGSSGSPFGGCPCHCRANEERKAGLVFGIGGPVMVSVGVRAVLRSATTCLFVKRLRGQGRLRTGRSPSSSRGARRAVDDFVERGTGL
jgi:hypothetical protein